MNHEHKFQPGDTYNATGSRRVEKSICPCGAVRREITLTTRYGEQTPTVLVTEPDGREWESHDHRH